ncbi:hypothetical protein COX27_00965 [Candidatus Kuenenbacteria bacterium CG23_combo_of_CG06-09_8_20_14_all_36_9]|uniref:Probable endonuclease 4 n=1 Tax=Candidatus Kuenenbacteria bacterium CG10_big_fil_rev_8_21_14_0_10_36_11 TaxID=1974618 RepID=A0A2M6WAN2_9BACT|nr:MAG: hypothetical protein COX27_00965 [Candidatus Kuenenbacteria bacterium CG23_combo_of_CG06-09_8_20_14_all_36_9]PIT89858.1 MAG: hypothetical protein COU23_01680 [Candidatus Kuenenbacteria bacterium CG10_big_fil_rev_8_21_14_0_10_36_11]
MKIGAHISAAGGVANAPLNAQLFGCECYQFFSHSPKGGKAEPLSVNEIKEFKERNKKYNFKNFYIHAPYYINLASAKNNIYYGSISVLREELERGSMLGVKYLMTHLGSAKELGRKDALKKVVQGIEKILTGYNGKTKFLIEMSAGAGEIIGDTFEEIYSIIHNTKPIIQKKIGVCFDTAHAFESGYDLRTATSVKKVLNNFDKTIGLKKLKLIHINDSKTALGARVDRHEHLGLGKIGLDGFQALVNEPRLKNIDFILETPTDKGVRKDIKLLKQLRKQV